MINLYTETAEDLFLTQCPEESQKGMLDDHTFEMLDSEEVTKHVYEFLTQTNKIENEFKALTLKQISSENKVKDKEQTSSAPIKEKTFLSFPELQKNDFIREEGVLNKAELTTLSPKKDKSALTQPLKPSLSEKLTFITLPSKAESTLQQSNKEKVREREKEGIKHSVLSSTIQKEESAQIKSDREKEREGKEGGQQEHKEQSDENKDKKRKRSSPLSANKEVSTDLSDEHVEERTSHNRPMRSFTQRESTTFGFPQKEYEGRPLLPLPQLGVVALYYILTKLGVISENLSQHGLQQQIRELDGEIDKVHKEIIGEMRKAAHANKSSKSWGVMIKVMSWIASFLTIATGVTLIATGAGVVGGGLLIAAGVLSLTNHFLEITGGWNKLATTIGGDDPVKTRSIIMWMQIGVAIISIVLAGAGVVFGGINSIKEAMGTAGMLSSAGAQASIGILLIGQGIMNKKYFGRMAQIEEKKRTRTLLKQQKSDLLDITEESLENMKNFWEDFFKVLEIQHSDTIQIININKR